MKRVAPILSALLVIVAQTFSEPASANSELLSSLLPDPLLGTIAVETNPAILGITNAECVRAFDYRSSSDRRIRAGLLLLQTSGDDPYDHNRKTCRLVTDGARLLGVSQTTIHSGNFYIITTSHSSDSVETAIQFYIRAISSSEFIVDSAYLGENLPSVGAWKTISVQVWGSDVVDAIFLASAVLRKLSTLGNVTLANTTNRVLPEVLMRSGSHSAGILSLEVVNHARSSIETKFEFHLVDTPGSSVQYSELTAQIPINESSIDFFVGEMSSVVVYSIDSNGFRDQMFVGRGFGYFTDVDAGGQSRISFSSGNCQRFEGSPTVGSFLLVPSCARIRGTVDRWAGIYLPVGSNSVEDLDLPSLGYDVIEFWARSTSQFRLQVEDVNVVDFDYHGVSFPGNASWNRYEVRFANLTQRGFGSAREFTGVIHQLSWVIDPPDGSNLAVDLEVDRVVLLPSSWDKPQVILSLPDETYHPGDSLPLGVSLLPSPSTQGNRFDLYLGLRFPDGKTYFCQRNFTLSSTLLPVLNDWRLAAKRGNLRYNLTGKEPLGQYLWSCYLTSGAQHRIEGAVGHAAFQLLP